MRSFYSVILLCVLSVFCSTVNGQTPPDIQALLDKMEGGRKLSPEEQQKFDAYMKSLNDRLKQALEKGKAQSRQPADITKHLRLPVDDLLPKFDPAAHYNTIPAATPAEYIAIVRKYKELSSAEIAASKPQLTTLFAKAKTGPEIADSGLVSLLAADKDGGTLGAAIFAVTSGAIKSPNDGNIANNFGVLLKNAGEYKDALKVLAFAEKQYPGSAIVQTNIGWSIAYLGDFASAKARFQRAIGLDKYDIKAYEGLGILYRVEGNAAEASKYLRMCLRVGFSIPAAKNLSLIEQKADIVIITNPEGADPDDTPGMRISDVLEFPYPVKTKSSVEFADAPDFFSSSVKKVSDAHKASLFLRRTDQKREEIEEIKARYRQMQDGLGPLRPEQMRNGNTIVIPRSYEREVYALVDMERVFSRRHLLRYAKFQKKFGSEIISPLREKYYALDKQLHADYAACNRDEPCQDAVVRTICRLRVNSILSYNPTFQGQWEKYVQTERDDIRKYFKLSAPWIAEIHDDRLREFMNLRREYFAKLADPVEETATWGSWEAAVVNNWSDDCGQDPAPSNTGNPLRNKLKVYPEPYGGCHIWTWETAVGAGPFGIKSKATCDSIALEVTAFDVYAGVDKKFGNKDEDDITTLHGGVGFMEGLKLGIHEGEVGGVEAGVKQGYYISTRNGEVVDHGVEGGIEAGIKAGTDPEHGFHLDNDLGNLANWKFSAEAGARDNGDHPVSFTSVLDELDK